MSTDVPVIYISIVSHGQGELAKTLLSSIGKYCSGQNGYRLKIIVTLNIEEEFHPEQEDIPFPLQIIKNSSPKGFGANHNSAFRAGRNFDFFCVLNPDIIFTNDPFGPLLSTLKLPDIGVAAPSMIDSQGNLQDNARKFPTPRRILARRKRKEKLSDFPNDNGIIYPDWVAGMFMLLPADVFSRVGGFDEMYHLYCEDADLCKQLRSMGYQIALVPEISMIHDARRTSHLHAKFLWWHISSLMRFFFRYGFTAARQEKSTICPKTGKEKTRHGREM
jgi:GT2 family glycosyltransferase